VPTDWHLLHLSPFFCYFFWLSLFAQKTSSALRMTAKSHSRTLEINAAANFGTAGLDEKQPYAACFTPRFQ
jgi:hypothetical protein